ncbi:MAG TPA: iron-containing alcohol dehydrogenase, partial [Solirubrobacteraceae bacterium]|nr:iron-containing alcohol dehydrogenase [Solirubrobacteraceae bacterium]
MNRAAMPAGRPPRLDPPARASVERFRQVEHDRTIVFGRGAIEAAGDLLGDGFVLLSTPRGRASAPEVVERAAAVIDVPDGRVDELAAELRGSAARGRLVGLGGGRVIDVAKALAAADEPRGVVAIPTTLSAAEMTGFHRQAGGVRPDARHVRPAVVINDPRLSGSQPVAQLAASTGNALGHAVVAVFSVRSNPVARAVGRAAVGHLVSGWAGREPDREELALGALLGGWAVDQSGLGPHHAICQTLARIAGVGHGRANVTMLESSVAGIRRRRPEGVEQLESELGVDVEAFARTLRGRAGAGAIEALHEDPGLLERVIGAAE